MSISNIQSAALSSTVVGNFQAGDANTGDGKGVSSFSSALAVQLGNTRISVEDVKKFFDAKPSASQIADQAASLGLNEEQVVSAMTVGGYGGGDAASLRAGIDRYVSGSGSNYSWAADGALIASNSLSPSLATAVSSDSPLTGSAIGEVKASASSTSAGSITVLGKTYTVQLVKDFYAAGGNDTRFAQEAGMTDLWQIHELAVQARAMGGAPTGEAALQNYYTMYKQNNPNGAGVGDYQGWLDNQPPNAINAMRAGVYTGAAIDQRDFEPGGLYAVGTAESKLAGYGRGGGPRGNGGSWTT